MEQRALPCAPKAGSETTAAPRGEDEDEDEGGNARTIPEGAEEGRKAGCSSHSRLSSTPPGLQAT